MQVLEPDEFIWLEFWEKQQTKKADGISEASEGL